MKLARQHGKLLKGERVAIFADQCWISQTSYSGGLGAGIAREISSRPGGARAGGNAASGLVGAGVNEIRAVSQK